MEGILVPIAFFAMLAAIFVAPSYFRARSRQQLMETLQVAYEKGQPVPPELIESLTVEPRTPRSPQARADSDLRGGIIWVAVALGLIAMGWAISFEEQEAFYVMSGLAAVPGFIGLALIALSVVGRGRASV